MIYSVLCVIGVFSCAAQAPAESKQVTYWSSQCKQLLSTSDQIGMFLLDNILGHLGNAEQLFSDRFCCG